MDAPASSGGFRSRPGEGGDPVARVRRELARRGIEIRPPVDDPGHVRSTREPVRSAEGGSVDQDIRGSRSSAPDPQRERSTGAAPGSRTRRGNRRAGGRRAEERDGSRSEDLAGSDVDPSGRGGDEPRRNDAGGTLEQAKEACLRLLAVRARSRAELDRRLRDKGFSTEITEQALHRMAEVGLVDDAAFAEQWVHARHTYSGKGKQALARELRGKGVAREDAESALSAITADDEHERATELVRRKLRSLPRDLEHDKAVRRLVGMLARRGYGSGTAFAVVKAELAQIDPVEREL